MVLNFVLSKGSAAPQVPTEERQRTFKEEEGYGKKKEQRKLHTRYSQ